MKGRNASGGRPSRASREGTSQRQPVPSLGPFLRSRVISVNGIVAALYLLVSIWIYLHPARARAIWRRLQGQ